MNKFNKLNEEDLLNIEGGIDPITIALGIGTLFVSAAGLGYKFGADLAKRKRK